MRAVFIAGGSEVCGAWPVYTYKPKRALCLADGGGWAVLACPSFLLCGSRRTGDATPACLSSGDWLDYYCIQPVTASATRAEYYYCKSWETDAAALSRMMAVEVRDVARRLLEIQEDLCLLCSLPLLSAEQPTRKR